MATDADSPRTDAEDDGSRGGSDHQDRPGIGARVGAAVKETVIVLAMALTLSFVVKTFLLQAFYIPSESMENTLLVGDRVIVSKLTPGPLEIERGDVVVFEDPGDWLGEVQQANHGAVLNAVRDGLTFVGLLPDTSEGHLIKRVVGLPGDRVQCCDTEGRMMINGKAVDESAYIKPGVEPSNLDFDITVPRDRVWVMGDNRDDSADSRFHDPSSTGADGSVPIDKVVGKAEVIVWPFGRFGRLSNHAEAYADLPRIRAADDLSGQLVAAR